MHYEDDFPEIDLRQRLTVNGGYGVTEIYIPEGSEFIGKTIDESGFPEKDSNVLTLYRGTTVVPNPPFEASAGTGQTTALFWKTGADERHGLQENPETPSSKNSGSADGPGPG
jgi:ribosomal protein S6--L-glutamate ligase